MRGFLVIDSQTERLEELQWARILVRLSGEEPPSMLEIGVEGVCYSLVLWWEVRPVMRVLPAERMGKNNGDAVGGVEGDVATRAGKRVVEVVEGVRSRPTCSLLMGRGSRQVGRGPFGLGPEAQKGRVWGTK